MEIGSNLNVSSNLMLDDEQHKPEHWYYPGDFLAQVHPSLVDSRGIDQELTRRQIEEYKRYIPCLLCKKSCSGTCVQSATPK
jgi:hypothetical protein